MDRAVDLPIRVVESRVVKSHVVKSHVVESFGFKVFVLPPHKIYLHELTDV